MSSPSNQNEIWNQAPVDEISMYQVMKVFFKRWRFLLILALSAILLALVKHKYFPTYPAKGTLIIKDVRNSQLQSMLNQVVGSVGEFELNNDKGKGDVITASLVLNTHKFHLILAKHLKSKFDEFKGKKEESPLYPLIKRFKSLEEKDNYHEVMASYLSAITKVRPGKSGQIYIHLKTGNRALSVALINNTLEMAKETLIERELGDLKQAEEYFKKEIDLVKKRLDRIENVTISKMQKSHILSVDVEKGESSRYMNELKKKINDTNIKITSNKRRIAVLKRKARRNKSKNDGVISKFNESAQIKMLLDENKELAHNLSAYRSTLKRYNKQKKGLLPFQHDIEKMKANYTFEYKVYESLRDSLAKIGLQKTYVKNKVEILERERLGRVRSSPGIVLMVLIAIFASQIIGLGSIYLFELFKPENDISGKLS